MHVQRIKLGIKVLRRDAANTKGMRFDLSLWGHSDNFSTAPAIRCGTTGCAMGLFVLTPEMQKLGLYNASPRLASIRPEYLTPRGQTYAGLHAAQRFFGISGKAARILFLPYKGKAYRRSGIRGAKAERAVANRMAELLRIGQQEFVKKYA